MTSQRLRALLVSGFLLCISAPSSALAQSTETSQEEARRFYTTTTVGLLVGLPLTIINNAAGNPADDSALALSSVSTNFIQLTNLSSSTSAVHIEAARMFARQNQTTLSMELAFGDGPVSRELLVTLGLPVAALDIGARRARVREEHALLLCELAKLGADEENIFLELFFRAVYLPL